MSLWAASVVQKRALCPTTEEDKRVSWNWDVDETDEALRQNFRRIYIENSLGVPSVEKRPPLRNVDTILVAFSLGLYTCQNNS